MPLPGVRRETLGCTARCSGTRTGHHCHACRAAGASQPRLLGPAGGRIGCGSCDSDVRLCGGAWRACDGRCGEVDGRARALLLLRWCFSQPHLITLKPSGGVKDPITGIVFPATTTTGGATLQLLGLGTRSVTWLNIAVCAIILLNRCLSLADTQWVYMLMRRAFSATTPHCRLARRLPTRRCWAPVLRRRPHVVM